MNSSEINTQKQNFIYISELMMQEFVCKELYNMRMNNTSDNYGKIMMRDIPFLTNMRLIFICISKINLRAL